MYFYFYGLVSKGVNLGQDSQVWWSKKKEIQSPGTPSSIFPRRFFKFSQEPLSRRYRPNPSWFVDFSSLRLVTTKGTSDDPSGPRARLLRWPVGRTSSFPTPCKVILSVWCLEESTLGLLTDRTGTPEENLSLCLRDPRYTDGIYCSRKGV